MRKLLLVLLLQIGMSTLYAQNFKFGKVSKEELQEKFNPADSSANATILFRKEYVRYNTYSRFSQIREVHERIKIYNKEGLVWATKYIMLFSGYSVNGLKGAHI